MQSFSCLGTRSFAETPAGKGSRDYLDPEYDHLSKARKGTHAEIDDEDFLPDFMAKDAPTVKRNPISINLPWLINGAPFNEI